MRIYRERIAPISASISDALIKAELIDVETEMRDEVELDIASVLTEYRRTLHELGERAKDVVAMRNLDYSHTHKIKAQLAAEKRFALGDEGIEYITQQILELLLASHHVDEVFGEDHELRRLIAPILRKELGVDSKLDREVRKRIRNLEEGTSDYDIEYEKTMAKVRDAQGFSDD